MEKTVQVEVRSVYGKELVYPANTLAENFSKLTGQKTFSNQQLQTIEAMGFEITTKQVDWRNQ